MKSSVITKIKSAPKEPGVYIFRSGKKSLPLRGLPLAKGEGVLYVGKAANLRARLKSYLKITDIKTEALHQEATRLDLIPLRSEIEALIEESRLIKELKPRYNVLWRDDKSYHYVYFTREAFPKIFIGQIRLKGTQPSRVEMVTVAHRTGPSKGCGPFYFKWTRFPMDVIRASAR